MLKSRRAPELLDYRAAREGATQLLGGRAVVGKTQRVPGAE